MVLEVVQKQKNHLEDYISTTAVNHFNKKQNKNKNKHYVYLRTMLIYSIQLLWLLHKLSQLHEHIVLDSLHM